MVRPGASALRMGFRHLTELGGRYARGMGKGLLSSLQKIGKSERKRRQYVEESSTRMGRCGLSGRRDRSRHTLERGQEDVSMQRIQEKQAEGSVGARGKCRPNGQWKEAAQASKMRPRTCEPERRYKGEESEMLGRTNSRSGDAYPGSEKVTSIETQESRKIARKKKNGGKRESTNKGRKRERRECEDKT